MAMVLLLVPLVALSIGALIGWLFAGRQAGGLKAERDGLAQRFKAAVTDLAVEAEARQAADLPLSALLAEPKAPDSAPDAQIAQPRDAQAAMPAQFPTVGQAMLGEPPKAVHQPAAPRLRQRASPAGPSLKAQPPP